MASKKKSGRPAAVYFERLRNLMAEMKVSRQEIGDVLGISGTSVSRKLSGESPWMLDEMYAVMDRMNLPIDRLYLYFPPGGEPVEAVENRYIDEYLEATNQALVSKPLLDVLRTVLEKIPDNSRTPGNIS